MNEMFSSGSGSPAGNASASAHLVSAAKLLEVWESGQTQLHADKALTLLAAAYPNATRETLAALTIGQRDARLISLREELFGAQLISLTDCPACSERLELSFNVLDIRTPPGTEPDASLLFSQSGYELQLRLPNSLDLLELTGCSTRAEMRAKLIEQCVQCVQHQGGAGTAEQLGDIPPEVIEAAIERISEADQQADVEVNLVCPSCEHAWQTSFDIVSYLWTELHAWATELLREVHLLASSYGWRESDILSLSRHRRRCYLELLLG
jgi:hypothetical protein